MDHHNLKTNRHTSTGKRRWLRVSLLLLFLAFLLLNAGAALHAWRLTRFVEYVADRPDPEKMSAWDRVVYAAAGGFAPKSRLKGKPGFPFTTFEVHPDSDTTLRGWESVSSPETTATIILCHGHGATRSAVLPEADFFHNLGLRVVMFDFRAHGESSGGVCSVGYYEADDVKAVWDYVARQHPDTPILLYGISMGAVAVSRAVAAHDIDPHALILEMPFDGLLDAVRARVRLMKLPAEPAATLLTFWGGVQLGFWGFDHATSTYLAEADCPVLLQWGTKDNRVSKEEITAIKSAIPATALALKTYEGIGHKSLCKNANGKWTESVSQWLSKTLNQPDSEASYVQFN